MNGVCVWVRARVHAFNVDTRLSLLSRVRQKCRSRFNRWIGCICVRCLLYVIGSKAVLFVIKRCACFPLGMNDNDNMPLQFDLADQMRTLYNSSMHFCLSIAQSIQNAMRSPKWSHKRTRYTHYVKQHRHSLLSKWTKKRKKKPTREREENKMQ